MGALGLAAGELERREQVILARPSMEPERRRPAPVVADVARIRAMWRWHGVNSSKLAVRC